MRSASRVAATLLQPCAMLANGPPCIRQGVWPMAVSYTHLDVYKRQGVCETVARDGLTFPLSADTLFEMAGFVFGVELCEDPVSYTHLASG